MKNNAQSSTTIYQWNSTEWCMKRVECTQTLPLSRRYGEAIFERSSGQVYHTQAKEEENSEESITVKKEK